MTTVPLAQRVINVGVMSWELYVPWFMSYAPIFLVNIVKRVWVKWEYIE